MLPDVIKFQMKSCRQKFPLFFVIIIVISIKFVFWCTISPLPTVSIVYPFYSIFTLSFSCPPFPACVCFHYPGIPHIIKNCFQYTCFQLSSLSPFPWYNYHLLTLIDFLKWLSRMRSDDNILIDVDKNSLGNEQRQHYGHADLFSQCSEQPTI